MLGLVALGGKLVADEGAAKGRCQVDRHFRLLRGRLGSRVESDFDRRRSCRLLNFDIPVFAHEYGSATHKSADVDGKAVGRRESLTEINGGTSNQDTSFHVT